MPVSNFRTDRLETIRLLNRRLALAYEAPELLTTLRMERDRMVAEYWSEYPEVLYREDGTPIGWKDEAKARSKLALAFVTEWDRLNP